MGNPNPLAGCRVKVSQAKLQRTKQQDKQWGLEALSAIVGCEQLTHGHPKQPDVQNPWN